MELIVKVFVGDAVAVNPEADPVAVDSTEKDVALGAGVPKTEKVFPSNPAFPVPAIMYSEPTTGVNGGDKVVNVKVITSALGLAYAVTAKAVPPLLLVVVNVGGAPGP